MTPTDESLALLLDPAREVPGWWRAATCPSGHEIVGGFRSANGDTWHQCLGCGWNHKAEELKTPDPPVYTGPQFSTSPVACFQHITPVLLELGCVIEFWADGCCVLDETGDPIAYAGGGISPAHATPWPLAVATTRALEWAHNNIPERLAEAVARVGEKNRG